MSSRGGAHRGALSLLSCFLASCVGGCGTSDDVRAPLPENVDPIIEESTHLPRSFLAAPVVLDLTGILRKLEEAVPGSFGNMEVPIPHPENDRVHVTFQAFRTPFVDELRGADARISATIEYQLRAW